MKAILLFLALMVSGFAQDTCEITGGQKVKINEVKHWCFNLDNESQNLLRVEGLCKTLTQEVGKTYKLISNLEEQDLINSSIIDLLQEQNTIIQTGFVEMQKIQKEQAALLEKKVITYGGTGLGAILVAILAKYFL